MSVSPEKRAKRAARGKRQRGGKADGADEEVNADGLIDDGADASFNPNEGRLGAPKRARGNTNSNNSSGKKHQPGSKSKSSNSHVKDPEEAAAVKLQAVARGHAVRRTQGVCERLILEPRLTAAACVADCPWSTLSLATGRLAWRRCLFATFATLATAFAARGARAVSTFNAL